MVFDPSVKKNLQENRQPLRPLLIMDEAPAHPLGSENDLLEEFSFLTMKSSPPNTTPLFPAQGPAGHFQLCYTLETLWNIDRNKFLLVGF